MLDEFKESQTLAYKILTTSIKKNESSHAYIFDTNGFPESSKLIIAFVKSLLCPNKYTNKTSCGTCHQCEVIESGNFPEIKIIKPDGLWIKKHQLQELQQEFAEKALIGTKRIYIIKHADRLNTSASNSILKFLEEPEEGIIAILQTDNIYNMLETIRSRCQIIRLINTTKKLSNPIETIKNILYLNRENAEEIINSEETDNKIRKVIEFVNYYEKNHLDTIIYMNKLWLETIKTKEEQLDAFDIMTTYYKDILNIKLNVNSNVFEKNKEIEEIIENNKVEDLYRKINIITSKKSNIKNNANTKLLMDKLIIDLEGGI